MCIFMYKIYNIKLPKPMKECLPCKSSRVCEIIPGSSYALLVKHTVVEPVSIL